MSGNELESALEVVGEAVEKQRKWLVPLWGMMVFLIAGAFVIGGWVVTQSNDVKAARSESSEAKALAQAADKKADDAAKYSASIDTRLARIEGALGIPQQIKR